jgi:hypothetical protein
MRVRSSSFSNTSTSAIESISPEETGGVFSSKVTLGFRMSRSDDTIEETDKRGGKVVGVYRMTVSKDGKSVAAEYTDEERGTKTGFHNGKAVVIGIGGTVACPPLPHHRTCGSAYGGSAG